MTEIRVMTSAEDACSNVRLTGAEHGSSHRIGSFAWRISAAMARYVVSTWDGCNHLNAPASSSFHDGAGAGDGGIVGAVVPERHHVSGRGG